MNCATCGKPATCFGAYEMGPEGYACDNCCGHGNEDGHCRPVAGPIAALQAIRAHLDAACNAADRSIDTDYLRGVAEAGLTGKALP